MIDLYLLASKFYWKQGTVQPYRPGYTFDEFMQFSTKDEYLAWRKHWRETYAELSKEIRRMRKEWRAEGSEHAMPLHLQLLKYRSMARLMLVLRALSKKRAEALYQASKEASQVA